MIIGIGLDAVEVDQVQHLYDRFGNKFLDRILTGEERQYVLQFRNPVERAAGRFAVKEAIIKILRRQERTRPVSFHDIIVRSGPSGAPKAVLEGEAWKIQGRLEIQKFWISLTHTRRMAVAVAVAES